MSEGRSLDEIADGILGVCQALKFARRDLAAGNVADALARIGEAESWLADVGFAVREVKRAGEEPLTR